MPFKSLLRDRHSSFEISLPTGETLRGDMTLARLETRVRILGSQRIKRGRLPERWDFSGQMDHGPVLSFLGAARMSPPETHGGPIVYYPHWVAFGTRALKQDDLIEEVSFSTNDAAQIFYDWRAFDADSLTPEEADARLGVDRVGAGRGVQLAWFSGEEVVCDVETAVGRFTARNVVIADPGGTKGVRIRSRIFLTLSFAPAVDFGTALRRAHAVRRFLEIVAGRRQRLKSLSLKPSGSDVAGQDSLALYACGDIGDPDARRPRAHITSLPLTNVLDGSAFPKVLSNWLAVDAARVSARSRFRSSFIKGESFSIDRLVAAANMFDLLPADAVPASSEVGDDLASAVDKAKESFGSLPQSYERDSVMDALGRIGKPSLKRKVLHRAEPLIRQGGHVFPELAFVMVEAVNARNLYVHGKVPRRRSAQLFEDNIIFLTEALEFVFACSELAEAGWNFNAWVNKAKSTDHVFSRFACFYASDLAAYKAAVQSAGDSK